jgi:chromosome segregation protein
VDVRVAVQHVLGRVLVVETLVDATRIGKTHQFRFRTVTLDGQVVLVGGAITGGSAPSADGSDRNLNRLKAGLDQLKRQRDAATAELRLAEQNLQAVEAELESLRPRFSDLKAVWQQEEHMMRTLMQADSLSTILDQEKALAMLRADLDQRYAQVVSSVAEHERALQAKVDERMNLARELSASEGAEALKRALRVRDLAERDRWQREHGNLMERLTTLESEYQATARVRDSALATVAQLVEQKTRLESEEAECARRQDELRAALNAMEEVRRALDQEVGQREAHMVDGQRRIDLIALRWESSPLEETEQSLEPLDAKELAQAEREIRRVKADLVDIGPIERGSLNRWRELSQRRDELLTEEEDVQAAKGELESTLSQLDDLVSSRVKETADKVEAAFKEACEILYGGASATFRWTTEDEPGIELWVAPPGKRPARLSLLSGGEKALGGLAWLFSLLSIRQAPFVVLDEVEASLDEWNAERFGRYLAERGSKSQFIVITHHKATMEAATALWGISGNGRGQSRVVSVKLGAPELAMP